MTDQTLTDAELLAWATIGEYRQRQRSEGLTILLLPFPPCPTCGKQVYDAETSTVERGIDRISTINMAPCGHAYTVTDDEIERVHQHLADLIRRMETADRSHDPNVRAWTTADVIRETQACIAPPVPADDQACSCGGRGIRHLHADQHVPINGEQSPRTTVNNPPASSNTASDQLRERLVESLDNYPAACWTTRDLAGRVMGVIGGELDRWEKAAREQAARADAAEYGRQMAVECFTVYRNDAKQLHATLTEVLDAFEAYWARASYCGPSETAIQPEHFRAWRDMLRPEALDARNAEAAIERVRKVIASFDGRGVIAPGHVNFDIPTAGEVLDKIREALVGPGETETAAELTPEQLAAELLERGQEYAQRADRDFASEETQAKTQAVLDASWRFAEAASLPKDYDLRQIRDAAAEMAAGPRRQPAHDTGPSVRECAAADRAWDAEREGE